MAHQWLLWLSYLLLFTADEICVAGIENPSHTPGSAAENADRSPNLTGFPDGSSSNKPAYCNGSRSWFEFKASRIVPNCRAADFLLKSSQIWPRGHTKYEFIPSGVPSQLKFSVIRTPLVVTSGKYHPTTQRSPWKVDVYKQSRRFLALQHSHRESEQRSSVFSNRRRDERTLSDF